MNVDHAQRGRCLVLGYRSLAYRQGSGTKWSAAGALTLLRRARHIQKCIAESSSALATSDVYPVPHRPSARSDKGLVENGLNFPVSSGHTADPQAPKLPNERMMSGWDIPSSFLTDEELREFGFADISHDGQNGPQQTQQTNEKNHMPTELVGLNAAPPTSGSDDNMPKVAWAHGCLEESIAPTNGFTNAIPTTAREQTTHEMGVKRVLKSTVVAGIATGSQTNNKKKRSCRPNPDKTLDKKTQNITNTRKKGLFDNHSSGSATSRPFLAKEESGLADIHNLPCVDGEKAIPGGGGEKPRSSQYRGVTKHKRSGRWEAHIWVKETGKQMYLGGYDKEEHAAEAYDVAAMKCKGGKTGRKVKLNFPEAKYTELSGYMASVSLEELVMAIRRQSQGFARGSSGFRGVTQHPNGRWEARIGMPNSKHIYLGLYNEESAAARAYDMALVRLRGPGAATNYTLANYKDELKGFEDDTSGVAQLEAKAACKEEVKNEEA